jgi:ubiquinone/menaquinone biosynthesis C-methylase UbiE
MQNQEKVWNALAEQWYHFRQQPFHDVQQELQNFARLKPGKILEIGCGNCRNLVFFYRFGFKCYGIDFSSDMIKQAKVYCKKFFLDIKLKKARAEKLPFPRNSFDYILDIATLHHLDKKEQEKSVKEMARVLKKGGFALVSVWKKPFGKEIKVNKNKKNRKEKTKEIYLAWHIKNKTYWRYYYVFDIDELKNLFQKHGFKIINTMEDKNLTLLVRKKV